MADELTGYALEDTYYATRYSQGQRIVFSIDLSLAAVAGSLPRPDAERPMPGNRRVKESHARGFAAYVRQDPAWVAPALILRSPDIFRFEPRQEVGGTQFGILAIPKVARTDVRILDGQHRILGLYLAAEDIARELEEQRSLLAEAKREGNEPLQEHFKVAVQTLEGQRLRMSQERISVQIHIEDDLKAAEQMFVDIADNALGISAAIRVRFDDRKVVNRSLDDVMRHALLRDRVDVEQDRIGGQSPYLLGAKHVADIIRTVAVGIGGRIGRRQETELKESALIERTNEFLDVLVAGFPQLEDLIQQTVTPEDLRETSLLGSATMLRVLAGVYYELAQDAADESISDFFGRLSAHMDAPIQEGSPWYSTGAVNLNAMAPMARGGDMQRLTAAVVSWFKDSPDWLSEAA